MNLRKTKENEKYENEDTSYVHIISCFVGVRKYNKHCEV